MAHSSERIPFNDLSRMSRAERDEIDAAIRRVVDSGWFVMGPEHDAFESELAAYVGVEHTIGVGNGTDALELALAAVGVGPGSTVLTVANAGGYTSTATRLLGARPVFVDVDPVTLQATAATVTDALEALDAEPDALVVTHLFGAMAPIEEIAALAAERGIPVVEDCAQAIGAARGGRKAGSFGTVATASFYPTKNLGALGDGGAVLTSDAGVADRVRRMRQYGWTSKYRIERDHGRNSRLDELQAAVLRPRLRALDAACARRREIHARYEAAAGAGIRLVNSAGDESFIAHLAVVDVDDREALRAALQERGIATDVHYPIPDHRQPAIAADDADRLLATDRAAGRILSLPLFPDLRGEEIDRVCAALAELG